MTEYASKGVAGTGLGLGIAGTALGVLAGSNNGNGLLGGLFGNNGSCDRNAMAVGVIAEKDAKIAELEAQKYSDKQDATLYMATRSENKTLRDELMAYIRPIADEASLNRERVAVLEAQHKCEIDKTLLREQLIEAKLDNVKIATDAKIDSVAQTCGCGIAQLNTAVANLQAGMNAITKTVIPKDVICPEVMARYNSWTAPTDVAPAVQPVTGTIKVS